MRNYYIHILIWGISIIISSIFAIYKKDSIYNIAIVWGMCAIFFVLYYLMKFIGFMKFNKINIKVTETGVFSGRAFGIFFNMFVLQYILELYEHVLLCVIFSICSIIILCLVRKDIKSFFTNNDWKFSYYEIYIALNLLLSSIGSIIGYYKDILIVHVDCVGTVAKIILMLIYVILTIISVIPNSFIMRVATVNDELK